MSDKHQFNSLSNILEYFVRMNENSLRILASLAKSVNSEQDVINVKNVDSDGTERNFTVPSVSYLTRKVNEIDRNVQKLYAIKDKELKNPIFGKVLVAEPDEIANVKIPTEFFTKPNFFLENLLNPLLYIKVDLTDYILPETKRLISHRFLLDLNNESKIEYFNQNFDKLNNLIYEDVIDKLNVEGISYIIDEDILEIPPIELKYSGTFDVINMDSEIFKSSNYSYVRKYTLNTLQYTDNSQNGVKETKSLKIGDTLISKDGDTEYIVQDIDYDSYKVILAQSTGYDVIEIGANILRIASEPLGKRVFQLPVTYNENQIIFLKAVDPYFHTISSDWGYGFAFKTKDLIINTDSGQKTFDEYYLTKVQDYSRILNNISIQKSSEYKNTESSLESVIRNNINKVTDNIESILPYPPVLTDNTFKIVDLNENLRNKSDIIRLDNTLNAKETLAQQKLALENQITVIENLITEEEIKVSPDIDLIEELTTEKNDLLTEKNDLILKIDQIMQDLKLQYNNGIINSTKIVPAVIGGVNLLSNIFQNMPYMTILEYRYRFLDGNKTPVHTYNIELDTNLLNTSYWFLWSGPVMYRTTDINGNFILPNIDNSNPDVFSFNEFKLELNELIPSYIEIQVRFNIQMSPTDPIYITRWSNSAILNYNDFQRKYDIRNYDLIEKEILNYDAKKEITDLNKIIVALEKRISNIESSTPFKSVPFKETIILTQQMIDNKTFELSRTPETGQVTLQIVGGNIIGPSEYTVYYRQVNWNNTSIMNNLLVGDTLIIEYLALLIQ